MDAEIQQNDSHTKQKDVVPDSVDSYIDSQSKDNQHSRLSFESLISGEIEPRESVQSEEQK